MQLTTAEINQRLEETKRREALRIRPFQVGDEILFADEHFLVLENHGSSGTVGTMDGAFCSTHFYWTFSGETCTLVKAAPSPESKQALAEQALAAYDFGDGVTVVEQGNWDTNELLDFTKIVYVRFDDDLPEADSHRINFHVRFLASGIVNEVYALEMESGNHIGSSAAAPAINTEEGNKKPVAILLQQLSFEGAVEAITERLTFGDPSIVTYVRIALIGDSWVFPYKGQLMGLAVGTPFIPAHVYVWAEPAFDVAVNGMVLSWLEHPTMHGELIFCDRDLSPIFGKEHSFFFSDDVLTYGSYYACLHDVHEPCSCSNIEVDRMLSGNHRRKTTDDGETFGLYTLDAAIRANTQQVFDPEQSFDSPSDAVELIKLQPDPSEALKAVVAANIDCGEFGFAAEVLQEYGGC